MLGYVRVGMGEMESIGDKELAVWMPIVNSKEQERLEMAWCIENKKSIGAPRLLIGIRLIEEIPVRPTKYQQQ